MDVHGFNVSEDLFSSLQRSAHIWLRMLGSLTFYRRLLNDHVFSNPMFLSISRASPNRLDNAGEGGARKLPTIGHAIAGIMAGATVSFIAGNQSPVWV